MSDSNCCGSDGLKKTVLNAKHKALGGNMVEFGAWEMPLWYTAGAVKEHLAVIEKAGLFDTSHMTVVLVEGPRARSFLNWALTKDISTLNVGRAAYSLILQHSGFSVDDAIVYPLSEERFALVLNACMGPEVIKHLQSLPGADTLKFTNLSGQYAKLDLQGPASFRILKNFVIDADNVFSSFPYFSFKGDFDFAKSGVKLKDGTGVLLSRTGYTGELGFEIFAPASCGVKLWDEILNYGDKNEGLIPCGLAARDSLRAGAVLPLSHQDIGGWPFINTPWPWALPIGADGKFSKKFVGCESLDSSKAEHTLAFVGFDPRKVETASAKVLYQGQEVGIVLTAVADMAIGRVDGIVKSLNSPDKPEGWAPRGLVCGFVKIKNHLPAGSQITLKDARRELKAEIVSDIRTPRSARQALR